MSPPAAHLRPPPARHPDLATLIWLVEAAREQQRPAEIVATNQTPSTDKLLEEYPPEEYGYTLMIAAKQQHGMVLELVA